MMCHLRIWPYTFCDRRPRKWQIVKGHYDIILKVVGGEKIKFGFNCARVASLAGLSDWVRRSGDEFDLLPLALSREQFALRENKESWSKKKKKKKRKHTVNCIMIPPLIHSFFNQPPFGLFISAFWANRNTNKRAHSWRHQPPTAALGRELFYSGSQLLGVYLSFVITIQ